MRISLNIMCKIKHDQSEIKRNDNSFEGEGAKEKVKKVM